MATPLNLTPNMFGGYNNPTAANYAAKLNFIQKYYPKYGSTDAGSIDLMYNKAVELAGKYGNQKDKIGSQLAQTLRTAQANNVVAPQQQQPSALAQQVANSTNTGGGTSSGGIKKKSSGGGTVTPQEVAPVVPDTVVGNDGVSTMPAGYFANAPVFKDVGINIAPETRSAMLNSQNNDAQYWAKDYLGNDIIVNQNDLSRDKITGVKPGSIRAAQVGGETYNYSQYKPDAWDIAQQSGGGSGGAGGAAGDVNNLYNTLANPYAKTSYADAYKQGDGFFGGISNMWDKWTNPNGTMANPTQSAAESTIKNLGGLAQLAGGVGDLIYKSKLADLANKQQAFSEAQANRVNALQTQAQKNYDSSFLR